MKVITLLLGVLLYFAFQDFRMRLVMALHIRGARAYVDRQSKRIIRVLFACAKFFIDFRIVDETSPALSLPDQFLLVSNHQSLLDIPVLLATYPEQGLRFVGKKELFHYILLISVVLRVQRHASIDRKRDFAKTTREIERLATMVAFRGYSLAVFPEGTRARDGVMGTFHSGAVRTILRTVELPVVSVSMDGGYRIPRLRQLLTNATHLRYRVKALSVYPPPKSKADIDALLRGARAEIAEQLDRWRAPAAAKVSR